MPPAGSLPWIAGVLEPTLGFLVLIGLWARVLAFVPSGLMATSWSIGYERSADVSLFDWAAKDGVSLPPVCPEEILRFLLHCVWRK